VAGTPRQVAEQNKNQLVVDVQENLGSLRPTRCVIELQARGLATMR
jgi:hypothetical protein